MVKLHLLFNMYIYFLIWQLRNWQWHHCTGTRLPEKSWTERSRSPNSPRIILLHRPWWHPHHCHLVRWWNRFPRRRCTSSHSSTNPRCDRKIPSTNRTTTKTIPRKVNDLSTSIRDKVTKWSTVASQEELNFSFKI